MAVKRRIVWFSDEDWAILQRAAKEQGDSISAILREFWAAAADPVGYHRATLPHGGGPSRVEHRRERAPE